MSSASVAISREPFTQPMRACELVVAAPILLLSVTFVLLMLPVTIFALPAKLILQTSSDAYCGFIVTLVIVAAINAVALTALLAYVAW